MLVYYVLFSVLIAGVVAFQVSATRISSRIHKNSQNVVSENIYNRKKVKWSDLLSETLNKKYKIDMYLLLGGLTVLFFDFIIIVVMIVNEIY